MPFKTLKVLDLEKETFEYTTQISDDEIAFIISESEKTIYVWNGQKASMVKKYKGGTLATKIKSLYHFYGFKTQTVNQGEEIGALREEVENLLQGSGTSAGEKGEATAEKAPAPIVSKASSAAKAGSATKVVAPAKVTSSAKVAPAKSATAGGADKRVKELQEELENERKKSAHKYNKLKEEMDELKGNFETQIAELREELDAAKSQASASTDSEQEISKLKEEKESLQVVIDGLKREIEAKESASSEQDITALQSKNDELASLNESLENKTKDLEATTSTLQAEIADLKAKAENDAPQEASTEELEALKRQVGELQETIENERKKADERASEYEDKIKEYEDKVAAIKEESAGKMREFIEEKESPKPVALPTSSPEPSENLDFASLDELDSKSSETSGLAFVNPYIASEIGGKVDPLTDLKSFLNTVDPSKPLDPELKRLLELISKQIGDDDEIVNDLQKVKKRVKDKKLDALLDDTIKKIMEKQS